MKGAYFNELKNRSNQKSLLLQVEKRYRISYDKVNTSLNLVFPLSFILRWGRVNLTIREENDDIRIDLKANEKGMDLTIREENP